MDYQSFIMGKKPAAQAVGLSDVPTLHKQLKPHQVKCVDFALRTGRTGLFLDTGLGKTFCQLEYLNHAAEAGNGKSLLLTPLAVAKQIEREAKHWGYDAKVIREQADATAKINICNYDRLHLIDAAEFVAVSLDESSILKSFTGKTTRALIDTFAGMRFKMAATATPAPNDHMELGQHAEFLQLMTAQEMLMRWFINDTATASQEWRLKGHAVNDFYDWMASWSRMASSPADMGCDATGYDLLPLNVINHRAKASDVIVGDGLFVTQVSATNMHDLKRQTAENRAKLAAEIVFGELLCGNQNTQKTAGTNINQTPTSVSAENYKPEAQSKTKNICANTTKTTKSSLSLTTKNAQSKTPEGVKDMQKTQNTGMNAKDLRQEERQKLGLSLDLNQHTECQNQTTTECQQNKETNAQYAEKHQTNDLLLTTATSQGALGDYCVHPVTQQLVSLKTVLSSLELQQNTSKVNNYWVVWCDTDYEQDMLEAYFGNHAVSIRGSQSNDKKEELHEIWMSGEVKVLISKPSLFGYGMNWQHCSRMIFAGRSFSYEMFYQAVRRCWRFGQTKQVDVHLIVAEGEDAIGRVIERKADDHEKMKQAMTAAMARAMEKAAVVKKAYEPTHTGRMPTWMR